MGLWSAELAHFSGLMTEALKRRERGTARGSNLLHSGAWCRFPLGLLMCSLMPTRISEQPPRLLKASGWWSSAPSSCSLDCLRALPQCRVEPLKWSWLFPFATLFRHFQNLETIKAAQWGLIVRSQSAGCCVCQIDVALGWLLC